MERPQSTGRGDPAYLHRAQREAAQAELDAFEAGPWGKKFPTVVAAWRRAWSHVIPFYAFPAFWIADMKPVRRGSGNQHLHETSDTYRPAVRRKLRAYHVYVELGCIAQGQLQHLSTNHTAEVWRCFRSWLCIMNPAMPPSKLIVANALRSTIPAHFLGSRFCA